MMEKTKIIIAQLIRPWMAELAIQGYIPEKMVYLGYVGDIAILK